MKEVVTEETALRPLIHTGKMFYAFVILLAVLTAWFGYAWYTQLTQGLAVTGLEDISKGTTWGLYLSNFIFFGGLGLGGIAISATVRLMKLESYKPITRIAEVLAVIGLLMAGLSIIFDLGRPDRAILHMLIWGRYQSPFLWDLTALTASIVGSLMYLYLGMRADLAICAEKGLKRSRLYKFLAMDYRHNELEKKKQEKALRWMTIVVLLILIIATAVEGWIFGLQISRPGWHSAIAGISFIIAAVSTGLAVVIILAGIFRRAYNWNKYMAPQIFRGLGWVLSIAVAVYLLLWFSELLHMMYAAPEAEIQIVNALLFGDFAVIFWPLITVGFIIPLLILLVTVSRGEKVSVGAIVFASVLLSAAFWVKRFLIVVPSQMFPRLYPPAPMYIPTMTEISVTLGTFWIAVLLYLAFVKLFPIIHIEVEKKG
jgi:molybdopterin-containing oxidoreductase family membrane subunit